MKTEAIRLAPGERIDVVKEEVGYSVIGPALVLVVKEEAAAGATAQIPQVSDMLPRHL